MSMVTGLYLLHEKPWTSKHVQIVAVANEASLYIFSILNLAMTATKSTEVSALVGEALIFGFYALVLVNTAMLSYMSIRSGFLKSLLISRRQ
jgi:hypothetical protein